MKYINNQSTKKQAGATMVEYGIMIALIAAIAVGTVYTLGQKVDDGFQSVVDTLNNPSGEE